MVRGGQGGWEMSNFLHSPLTSVITKLNVVELVPDEDVYAIVENLTTRCHFFFIK